MDVQPTRQRWVFTASGRFFYTRTDRPDDVITVWIAVDRVDVENGALYGFPGSHMQGMVPSKKDYKYLLSRAPEIVKLLFRTLWDNGQKLDPDVGSMERFIYSEIPTAIEKVPMNTQTIAVINQQPLVMVRNTNFQADR